MAFKQRFCVLLQPLLHSIIRRCSADHCSAGWTLPQPHWTQGKFTVKSTEHWANEQDGEKAQMGALVQHGGLNIWAHFFPGETTWKQRQRNGSYAVMKTKARREDTSRHGMPTHLRQGQSCWRSGQGGGFLIPRPCRGMPLISQQQQSRCMEKWKNSNPVTPGPARREQFSESKRWLWWVSLLRGQGLSTRECAGVSGCVRPSSLCTAQRRMTKGNWELKSSPCSAPQALP